MVAQQSQPTQIRNIMSCLKETEGNTAHPSAKEQLDNVWEALKEQKGTQRMSLEGRKWPGYDELLHEITNADYNEILTCPMDMRAPQTDEKSICPFGVVCRAKIELFPLPQGMEPYTGLLSPDTTLDHCLVRLSSAMKPPSFEIKSKFARSLLLGVAGKKLQNAKLFPTAAVKVFRGGGSHSGNLLLLGCKVGQPEEDYFAHCLSTQATEKMPKMLKPFVKKFWTYSDHPLSLGTSDFCGKSVDGIPVKNDSINFPYIVVFKPIYRGITPSAENDGNNFNSFDRFLDDVHSIPEGSHLFDIFAAPDPKSVADPSKLQRIGRIVSTSSMMKSSPNDRLFFKHQRREEDFVFRPNWHGEAKSTQVIMDGGKLKGPVAAIAGWRLFEEQIVCRQYVDYEKINSDDSVAAS